MYPAITTYRTSLPVEDSAYHPLVTKVVDHHPTEDMVSLLEEGTVFHLADHRHPEDMVILLEEADFHPTEVEALAATEVEALAAEGSHPAEAERPPHMELHTRIRPLTTLPSH
jgi:hypothetical protein